MQGSQSEHDRYIFFVAPMATAKVAGGSWWSGETGIRKGSSSQGNRRSRKLEERIVGGFWSNVVKLQRVYGG